MKKYLFLILVFFLVSCTSERSFQMESQKNPDYGKSKEVKRLNSDDVQHDVTLTENNVKIEEGQAKNILPEIKNIRLIPEIFYVGDTLGVAASGTDADGDDVTLFYEWLVNGEAAGNSDRLDMNLKRGDKILLEVKPYDGKEYGRTIALEREILNFPPVIRPHETVDFDGKTYMYQVKAQDPDGDRLSYSLASAPDGMVITPTSGLIIWDVPSEFSGLTKVSIVVEDGHGGKAQYDLNVTIKLEQAGL